MLKQGRLFLKPMKSGSNASLTIGNFKQKNYEKDKDSNRISALLTHERMHPLSLRTRTAGTARGIRKAAREDHRPEGLHQQHQRKHQVHHQGTGASRLRPAGRRTVVSRVRHSGGHQPWRQREAAGDEDLQETGKTDIRP